MKKEVKDKMVRKILQEILAGTERNLEKEFEVCSNIFFTELFGKPLYDAVKQSNPSREAIEGVSKIFNKVGLDDSSKREKIAKEKFVSLLEKYRAKKKRQKKYPPYEEENLRKMYHYNFSKIFSIMRELYCGSLEESFPMTQEQKVMSMKIIKEEIIDDIIKRASEGNK